MKTWLRRCHLVLALTSGLFILSLSLSGSLLVFSKDIQAWLNPSDWLISQNNSVQRKPLALSQLLQKIALVSDANITFIEQPQDVNAAWLVRLSNNDYLNINPYTGEVLLRHHFFDTFYGFVMSWHRWLLFKTHTNKMPLQVLMSIASLILIIELIIGCYLWLKPKKPLQRLKVKWRSKRKVLLYQLHSTLGVFACLPLILIAFSGMAFHWQPATQQIVEWLTMSQVQRHHFTPPVLHQRQGYHLDKAFQSAQSALPDGKVYRVYLPNNDNEPLALRIKMPNESHANSWSWADPYSGALLDSFDASKTNTASKIWYFRYNFHIGDFIAWPIKVLWFVLSLVPSFLVLSGLYLYIKRRQKLRRAPSHTP